MKPRLLIALAAAAALGAGACTSRPPDPHDAVDAPVWVPVSAQLASYEDCDEALAGIQNAAIEALSTWETDGLYRGGMGIEERSDAGAAAEADSFAGAPASAADGSFSETNNAVGGVDEPDIVKTDGTFVYSVANYQLSVVDTRSAEVVAERDLDQYGWDHQLFLADNALLMMYTQNLDEGEGGYSTEFRLERLDPETLDVLDTFAMEGSMADARLVDGEVRLAVSSQPHIQPVWDLLWDGETDADEVADALRDTEIGDWLPDFDVNGEEGEVACGDVAHPERFTGSSVSVLALPADGVWSAVEPHAVMADGETVHGTAESLYLAHYDYAWGEEEPEAETEIYRFAFSGGQPSLAGEAAVPGSLLSQYSLSEYDGHLRVATTENEMSWGGCPPNADCIWGGPADESAEPSKSTVTVFAVGSDSLEETGSVTDLGVDEQIYAVRFIGDTGYVVTFRQTDPLYTIDLADPANPTVTGELKITGYSGYLHPVGPNRLLGVGQEATDEGQTTGLQVSLFDTGAAEAAVLDQYEEAGAQSSVEWEPHAFLYWEETGTVVLPVSNWSNYEPETGAVVLEIGDDSIAKQAWITQDEAAATDPYMSEILRSLVIDGQLWTVSNLGLQANELGGDYEVTAWVAF